MNTPARSALVANPIFRSARRVLPPFILGLFGLLHQPSTAGAAGTTTLDRKVPESDQPEASKYVKPVDGFSWSAPKRMSGWIAAWKPQTWPEKAFPAVQSYDPNYVNPKSWTIDVQGCVNKTDFDLNTAGKDALNVYTWTFNGVVQSSKRCVRQLTFPAQGIYPVTMDVTDATGKKLLSKTRPVRVRDLLIVVLGDSMSSGEGTPDKNQVTYSGQGPKWVDRQCHRSAYAPGALAAEAIEKMDPETSVTFLSFACSGATIDRDWPTSPRTFDAYERDGGKMKGTGILGRYLGIESPTTAGIPYDMVKYVEVGGKGIPSQVDQMKYAVGTRPIDAIVMSAGLNDSGFSRMLATCLVFKDCPKELVGDNSSELPMAKRFENDTKGIPASYEKLGKAIDGMSKRVVVFEYPNPFTGDNKATCETVLDDVQPPLAMTKDESNWAQTRAEPLLHNAIRAGANKAGFEYIGGVWEAFKGHGYCASDSKRWLRRATESVKMQGPGATTETTGTIHPNAAGYSELSKFIVNALTNPAENTGPKAASDGYHAVRNTALVINATSGLLRNDTSPVLTAKLTVANNTQPNGGKGGKVDVKPDGSFTYTPPTNFVGSEKFLYSVSDGIRQSTTTVTFNVTDGRTHGR